MGIISLDLSGYPIKLQHINHIPYLDGKEGIYKWYHHHFGKVGSYRYSFSVDTAADFLSAIKNDFGMEVVPSFMIQKRSLNSSIVCSQLNDKVPSRVEKEFIKFISP